MVQSHMEPTLLYQCWIIILVPSTKSHGANSVVSMLDHYFSTHSLKESVCYCHADNCVGQNKNRFVIGYFAWQALTGKHTQIHLSFMEVGHTRCLVAGYFGNHIGAWIVMPLKHLVEATHCSTVHIFLSYLQGSGKLRNFS